MLCTEESWLSSVTFELGIEILLSAVLLLVFIVFGRSLYHRYEEVSKAAAKLTSPAARRSIYFGGFRKQECLDIGYILAYLTGLTIEMILSILHFTPQFEHSLVQEKNQDGSPDFTTLSHFCRFERTTLAVLVCLFSWLQFRLIFSRLFSVFSSSPSLRFSKRMEFMVNTILIDLGSLIFICAAVSMVPPYICVGTWTVMESGSKEKDYYNCTLDSAIPLIIASSLHRFYLFTLNLVCLCLFLSKFWQMIALFNRRQSQSSINNKQNDRILNDLCAVMTKLTTLSLTAIISSVMITMVVVALYFADWSFEWLWQTDHLINLICLILLFTWMDDCFQLLCVRGFPLIYTWVASHITDHNGIATKLSSIASFSNSGGVSQSSL